MQGLNCSVVDKNNKIEIKDFITTNQPFREEIIINKVNEHFRSMS